MVMTLDQASDKLSESLSYIQGLPTAYSAYSWELFDTYLPHPPSQTKIKISMIFMIAMTTYWFIPKLFLLPTKLLMSVLAKGLEEHIFCVFWFIEKRERTLLEVRFL